MMMARGIDSVSATVQNMIERYGDDALAEVELRIEELKSLKHEEAFDLWSEVRKVLRSQRDN